MNIKKLNHILSMIRLMLRTEPNEVIVSVQGSRVVVFGYINKIASTSVDAIELFMADVGMFYTRHREKDYRFVYSLEAGEDRFKQNLITVYPYGNRSDTQKISLNLMPEANDGHRDIKINAARFGAYLNRLIGISQAKTVEQKIAIDRTYLNSGLTLTVEDECKFNHGLPLSTGLKSLYKQNVVAFVRPDSIDSTNEGFHKVDILPLDITGTDAIYLDGRKKIADVILNCKILGNDSIYTISTTDIVDSYRDLTQ